MTREEFFYANAGYSYDASKEKPEDGRTRCAAKLANAERWVLSQEDLEYQISPDPDGDDSWMTEEERKQEHECIEIALIRKHPKRDDFFPFLKYWREETLASLCGIWDADDNYIRVVSAELALQAMPEEEKNA